MKRRSMSLRLLQCKHRCPLDGQNTNRLGVARRLVFDVKACRPGPHLRGRGRGRAGVGGAAHLSTSGLKSNYSAIWRQARSQLPRRKPAWPVRPDTCHSHAHARTKQMGMAAHCKGPQVQQCALFILCADSSWQRKQEEIVRHSPPPPNHPHPPSHTHV